MPKPLVKSASDDGQVRKAKLSEKERAEEKRHSLGVVLSTYEGRQDRWELLESCKIHESVFSTDPLVMANLAGVQDLGHRLLATLVTHYPQRYLQMQAENMERAGQTLDPEPTTEADPE